MMVDLHITQCSIRAYYKGLPAYRFDACIFPDLKSVLGCVSAFQFSYPLSVNVKTFSSYALDTAALLGGNEYLVAQMLDKLAQTPYGDAERRCAKWACAKLMSQGTLVEEGLNQRQFTEMFGQYHRDGLPSK